MSVLIILGIANVLFFGCTVMVLFRLRKAIHELREAQESLKDSLTYHGLLRDEKINEIKAIEHETVQ